MSRCDKQRTVTILKVSIWIMILGIDVTSSPFAGWIWCQKQWASQLLPQPADIPFSHQELRAPTPHCRPPPHPQGKGRGLGAKYQGQRPKNPRLKPRLDCQWGDFHPRSVSLNTPRKNKSWWYGLADSFRNKVQKNLDFWMKSEKSPRSII